ncbi:DUF4962 domain-containing protein [bacterium]|nr:DUF4962 domain-containing protein [bacterium]
MVIFSGMLARGNPSVHRVVCTEKNIKATMTILWRQRVAIIGMVTAFMAICHTARAAEPVVWDFESGTLSWRPAAKMITVSRAQGVNADGQGKASLRVCGSCKGLADYASSGALPMTTRQFFRLSAWVRIDHPGTDSPLPFVKCVFEAQEPGTWLGQALTARYDTSRMGTWQRLTGEFRVPYGTERGRIVLGSEHRLPEQNSASAEIDVYLDGVTLEPIEHLSIEGKYYLKPVPPELERMRGVHPRLYLTGQRIGELKSAIKTTHAALWKEFIAQADKIARQEPPKYRDESEWTNTEQLYMRPVGDNMPFLALAYVLTGERKYLDSARTWALAACGYPTWGLYEFENSDLSTGHQLFGLALVYDWCWRDLDDETRRTIRETLIKKSAYLFDVAAKGIIVKDSAAYAIHPWPEWDEAFLQNHLWINSCGIAAAGLAIFDEDDEAGRWVAYTLDRYHHTMAVLGDDGASHEGPGYWSYGVEWMLKFMYLARDLTGDDMYDHPWWRKTAMYRLYMGLPQNSWSYSNTTVDYGDSPRYDWYGADYMLRALAHEYRDGYAQWLADALDRANAEHPIARWLNLLWYDPSVKAIPPDGLPTLRHFPDIDLVTARSDWSGDESFVFFKCGPYIGHTAIREFTYCPSSAHHVHPDTGNFMVFACGEWLIRDDGYRAKFTGYHNTLLIDSGEQLGGGGPIFNGAEPHGFQARPRIIRAVSAPGFDHITGDVAEAYPKAAGLRCFVRHLLFLKPDVLIVADDIALDMAHDLELRFHPEQQEGSCSGNAFVMHGKQAVLRLDPLVSEGVDVSAESIIALPKEPDEKGIPLYTVRLRKHGSQWRNAVALSWAKTGGEPVTVTCRAQGDTWTFTAGGRTVTLNWKTGEAK